MPRYSNCAGGQTNPQRPGGWGAPTPWGRRSGLEADQFARLGGPVGQGAVIRLIGTVPYLFAIVFDGDQVLDVQAVR